MAQVIGGSDFDFVWADKIEATTLLMQEFSDLVAARSHEETSADKIIPVILKIFALQYSWYGNPRRRALSDWQAAMKPVQQELKGLKSRASESELDSIESQLSDLVTSAIAGWREGDPEFPKTEAVLNDMVRILFTNRFIKNPPRSDLERTNV
jgi:hypothetical protein